MAKTITRTVYTFAELLDLEKQGRVSSRAMNRAREWMSDGLNHYEWWEFTYNDWREALEQIGFMEPDISFRGFASQGDGASFTARVDLDRLIRFLGSPSVDPSETHAEPGDTPEFRAWMAHQCRGIQFRPKFRRLLWCINHIEAELRRIHCPYVHERTVRLEVSLNDRSECIGDPASVDGWKSATPRVRRLFDEFQSDACQLVLDLCRAIYADLEAEYMYRTSDEAYTEDADANEWTFDIDGRRDG